MDIGNNIQWSQTIEEYLKSLAEKSHCYSYLHKEAETLFNYRKTFIDIPCITLSTICGTLSIGNSSLFSSNYEHLASILIGSGSLFVGILGTINSYFSWGKRAENHRLSHLQYGKLYRFLQIELSLPRDERINCNDLMKIIRENYERLQEMSPLIPYKILDKFKNKFQSYNNKISFPSETNGLEEVKIYNNEPVNSVLDDIIQIEKSKSQTTINTI